MKKSAGYRMIQEATSSLGKGSYGNIYYGLLQNVITVQKPSMNVDGKNTAN